MLKYDMISLVGGDTMKLVYIPTKCPKCENKVFLERLDQYNTAAYCKSCDFILQFTEDELKYADVEYLNFQ